MSLLRKKQWWHNVIILRVLFLVLLILCFLLTKSVFDRFMIERDMSSRRAVAEEELNELLDRKAGLEEKVEYLREERGIESEIRKHFDVAKEGEQVVVLLDDERNDKTEPATTTVNEDKKSSLFSRLFPW